MSSTPHPYFVYILICSDKSFYVGHTTDVDRLQTHNEGRGARWTALRLPVQLTYHERYDTQELAIRREQQLKGWSRAKKQALIDGNLSTLKQLARCRMPTR